MKNKMMGFEYLTNEEKMFLEKLSQLCKEYNAIIKPEAEGFPIKIHINNKIISINHIDENSQEITNIFDHDSLININIKRTQ